MLNSPMTIKQPEFETPFTTKQDFEVLEAFANISEELHDDEDDAEYLSSIYNFDMDLLD